MVCGLRVNCFGIYTALTPTHLTKLKVGTIKTNKDIFILMNHDKLENTMDGMIVVYWRLDQTTGIPFLPHTVYFIQQEMWQINIDVPSGNKCHLEHLLEVCTILVAYTYCRTQT